MEVADFFDVPGAFHAAQVFSVVITQGKEFYQYLMLFRSDWKIYPETRLVPFAGFHFIDDLYNFVEALFWVAFPEICSHCSERALEYPPVMLVPSYDFVIGVNYGNLHWQSFD